MWAPSDGKGKRVMPWNPMDTGIVLFDIQTKQIVDEVPFMSLGVYANSNRRHVLFSLETRNWWVPYEDTMQRQRNGQCYHYFLVSPKVPEWVPGEIQVMATLLT